MDHLTNSSPTERLEAAQQKLTKIMVAGCTCMTKTPELRYHDERCHFRLAAEASLLLGTHALIGGVVATTPLSAKPSAKTAVIEAFANIMAYVRGKDDLYGNGAIRQFAEEGLAAFGLDPEGNPLPNAEPTPQRAQDNPTNLPESLGATVHEALTKALEVQGYRTDGDIVTLARRCHFMALEDRDLLGGQKALASRYKAQRDEARAAHQEPTVMRLCEIGFVTPRPGQLYRFTVDPTCDRCKELDAPYAEERKRLTGNGQ